MLVATATGACAPDDVGLVADEVMVQLFWYHRTEFAGHYAADQLGH